MPGLPRHTFSSKVLSVVLALTIAVSQTGTAALAIESSAKRVDTGVEGTPGSKGKNSSSNREFAPNRKLTCQREPATSAIRGGSSLPGGASPGGHSGGSPPSQSLPHGSSKSSDSSCEFGSGDKFFAAADGVAPYNPHDPNFINKFLKPGTYMRTNEIKPGMEGYGLSVFHGMKVERFKVKVIGVMKRVINGEDAILIRLSGEAMGKNCVVRGMSGSPIYINDKLIGALSYGFDFSREPIAGVTPICDMLDALAEPRDVTSKKKKISEYDEKPSPRKSGLPLSLNAVPSGLSGTSDVASGTSSRGLSGASGRASAFDEIQGFRRSMVGAGAPKMVPLMAPVSLSGFSPRAAQFLKGRFAERGLEVSEGGVGGLDEELGGNQKLASTLQPGSSVGVMLSTGDFASAATGTVTNVFGNRVLAFGHPFMQAGDVDFPMTTAYIHDILSSLAISFKLSSPVKVVGSIFSDRPWSVGGELGHTSRMVPVTVNVHDRERHIKKTFKSQVINHPDLTPELLAGSAMSAIDATYQSAAPYIARLESNIEVYGEEPIRRIDRFSSGGGGGGMSFLSMPFFSDPVAGYVWGATSKVVHNRFRKAAIKGVSLNISLEPGRNVTRITQVSTDKSIVKPGESFTLRCLMEPFDDEPFVKELEMTVPRDAPDGDIAVGVCGGNSLEGLRRRMEISDPPFQNLHQIIKRVNERPPGDKLVAVLALPDQAIHIDGEVIQSPPGHWNRLFFSNRYTHGPVLVNGEVRQFMELDEPVDGNHIVAVTVKRPDRFLKKDDWFRSVPNGSGRPNAGVYITPQAQKALGGPKPVLDKGSSAAPITGSTPSEPVSVASGGKKGQQSQLNLWTPVSDDTHMRAVQVWSQSDEASYKDGTKSGVTVDSWGRMFPAFEESGTSPVASELRGWSGTWSKGSFWFAAGKKIFKWDGTGSRPIQVAELDAVIIPAMAADSKGRIYASLVPDGRVVMFDPPGGGTAGSGATGATAAAGSGARAGKVLQGAVTRNAGGVSASTPAVKIVCKLPEAIVTTLCFDDRDNLYIGVANQGKVYKACAGATGELETKVLFDTKQAHVLTLHFSNFDGRLYVGTGERGNVYSVDATGKAKVEYQSDDHLVTGVARLRNGDLYITTVGEGHFVRIKPSGQVIDLASSEGFYTLYYEPSTDSVIAGDAEGDITQIQEEPLTGQAFFVPVKHTEQEAVVALSGDGQGRLVSLTSNLPVVANYWIRPRSEATFVSPVKDASRPAVWSRLRLYGSYNEVSTDLENSILVETRTGATAEPDATWTNWQPAVKTAEGFKIQAEPARYIQYKLTWNKLEKGKDIVFPAGRESVLGRIAVTYLPTNLDPTYSVVSLRSGAYLSETEEISITASDPDGDSLAMAVDISTDNGKSWTPLKSNIRPEKNKDGKPEVKAEEVVEDGKDAGKDKDDKDKDPGKDKEGKDKEKEAGSSSKDSSDKGSSEKGSSEKGSSDKDPSDKAKGSPADKGSSDKDSSDKGSSPKEPGAKASMEQIAFRELDDGAAASGQGDSSDKAGSDDNDGSNNDGKGGAKDGSASKGESSDDASKDDATKDKDAAKDGSGDKSSENKNGKTEEPGKTEKDKPKDKPVNKDSQPGRQGKYDDKNPGTKAKESKTDKNKKADAKKDDKSKKEKAKTAGNTKKADTTAKAEEKFVWSFNTKEQKDRDYLLRFTISDSPSNVTSSSNIKFYRFVVIDNGKPQITAFGAKHDSGGKFILQASASDDVSPIANAVYKIDGGEQFAFVTEGGDLADTKSVKLMATDVELKKGSHEIEIEVTDQAGNKATKTIKVRG